jgi:hypothetical protein
MSFCVNPASLRLNSPALPFLFFLPILRGFKCLSNLPGFATFVEGTPAPLSSRCFFLAGCSPSFLLAFLRAVFRRYSNTELNGMSADSGANLLPSSPLLTRQLLLRLWIRTPHTLLQASERNTLVLSIWSFVNSGCPAPSVGI